MRLWYAILSSISEYEVVVVTGDARGAGTDANVSVTIFGKQGQTEKMILKSSSKEDKLFERGNSDIFHLKANGVGPMTKLRYIDDINDYILSHFNETWYFLYQN